MPKRSLDALLLALLAPLVLGGCAAHKQYRTDYEPCESADPVSQCRASAVQRHRAEDGRQNDYLLGFVEFDDQGQLWDRQQMRSVLDALYLNVAEHDVGNNGAYVPIGARGMEIPLFRADGLK